MSSSSHSKSSSSDLKPVYDVFCSFRFHRESTAFVSEIIDSLSKEGIKMHDPFQPKKDKDMLTSHLQAIQDSRMSVVLLTRRYVTSRRCLDELEKIMEWHRTVGHVVLPVVLYGNDVDVDVDMEGELPEEDSYGFGDVSSCLTKFIANEDMHPRWRSALTQVAKLPGWKLSATSRGDRIRRVIEYIDYILKILIASNNESKNLVGLDRVQDVIKLLNDGSNYTLIVEIWGKGGIGKTTIAKIVYNEIGNLFEGKSFLANIREIWDQDDGQAYLQEQLLSDIFETKNMKMQSTEERKTIMKEILRNRRIFLVLDDVNELDQVNALCGSGNWLGPGSRIIITTQDKHPVSKLADIIYEVRPLCHHQGLRVFWWHALKQGRCRPEFQPEITKFSASIVHECKGLPLALEVLGSFLSGRAEPVWKSVLSKLKVSSNNTILELLKISYDDLDAFEKDIFLDISCFFIGKDRFRVTQTLNDSGVVAETAINELIERRLVTVDENNKLQMHDLLKEMGREIIVRKPKSKWTYDVFLSFRGEDTRRSFTSYLYAALKNAGIKVFMDNELERGEDISFSLLQAIETSRIAIIIFSTNYTDSKWCLDELEKIIECQSTISQEVMPLFYDVDPSDVRKQSRTFGEAFNRLINRISTSKDKVSSWRMALTRAANLSGWDSRNYGTEIELIDHVLDTITKKVDDSTYLSIANHPVGVRSRVQDVADMITSLTSKSDGILIVGIWGMSGIGKTTIAKAIYNKIGGRFEVKSFLANIKEVWEQDYGQVYLQEQLLSDNLKTRRLKLYNIELGKTIIKESFHQKMALVMLDDVNKLEQLSALCGSREWFGPGSTIIITTQDEHLLSVLKVDALYRMRKMGKSESVELFSWHAFKQACPPENYIELSGHMVEYSGGLPLALEVLGSYLFDRPMPAWESVLQKLKKIPNDQIQRKLKLSYDGLNDDMEKEIFLDICCFFIGQDRHYVTELLNGCGLDAEIGISILIERSLITVDKKNKLCMHNLMRDMGREIVREESRKHPEERSRLWFHADVVDVLMKHTGTEAVEGLALKFPNINEVHFDTKAFEKMKRLRLLQLDHVKLTGDYQYLPKALKWLCWHGFPLRYTPDNFDQGSLVAIDLKYSKLKLVWKEPQLLVKLKFLNLSHSRWLTETPDFSGLPNLERLILKDCQSLSKVHQTIGSLNKLLLVNLKDCKSLSNLPRSIYKLKSLKTLILSGCSMINKLEEDIEQMESLTTLMALDTAISQVPFSLVRLKSISYISLCGREGLPCDVFPYLVWSWTSPISDRRSLTQASGSMPSLLSSDIIDTTFHGLSSILGSHSQLRSLKLRCESKFHMQEDMRRILDALYGTDFTELETMPSASQMLEMGTSIFRNSDNQVHILGSERSTGSLWIFLGEHSEVPNSLREIILQGQGSGAIGECFLSGEQCLHWQTYKGEGSSVLFTMPEVTGCKLKGVGLCITYSSSLVNMAYKYLRNVLIINHTKGTIQLHKREVITSPKVKEWQFILSDLEPGDEVAIVVVFGQEVTVDTTTVSLVYGSPLTQRFIDLNT